MGATTKILITGAGGQIGQVLSKALAEKYGIENVVLSDIRDEHLAGYTYEKIDVTNRDRLTEVVRKHEITQIYHLAALLSASGERDIHLTWKINFDGFINVLEVMRVEKLDRLFYPSSIAVYGTDFETLNTPQNAYRNPSTMYGISKVAGESWAQYYWSRYKVDSRSIRYPGIIGYQSLPGGGTTDYAVDIFHQAIKTGKYDCFLSPSTSLPMIYMRDAIRATLELMAAPVENISVRNSYNLNGVSFTPAELAAEISLHIPNFEIEYNPDARQLIAETWPQSMDDSKATKDWGWKEEYDLSLMVKDMISNLNRIYNLDKSNYVESN